MCNMAPSCVHGGCWVLVAATNKAGLPLAPEPRPTMVTHMSVKVQKHPYNPVSSRAQGQPRLGLNLQTL
jgi:hypothetical protein